MKFKRVVPFVPVVLTLCLVALLAGCNGGSESGSNVTPTADASGRCPHEIKQEKCPFCTPSLIESEGFCGEHGVAEALCYLCRPYLKAAFRAKGDWCAEHNAPDSQCVACHPELKDKMKPGSGHGTMAPETAGTPAADQCEHKIAQAKCPFCTPSLLESEGFCGGHNVPEALCVKCRPYLKTAFIAKGDWCAQHDTPESQCTICNPDLNKPSGSGAG
jgi:hypothetical protein